MSKNHKKVPKFLYYIEHLFILASAVTGCVSISDFVSLVGIPIGASSSAVEIKIWTTTTGIKMYKSIIKKNNNKLDKLIYLAKTGLNNKEILISKALAYL